MSVAVRTIIALIAGCLNLGCLASASEEGFAVTGEQAIGQDREYTKFELDAAFRKDAREFIKLDDPSKNYNVCCVLVHTDVLAVQVVSEHFEKNTGNSAEDYGFVVQETSKHYLIGLSPRYSSSVQTGVDGIWLPDVRDDSLRSYSYLLDRENLEIIDHTIVSD